jgi:hypothetical protein
MKNLRPTFFALLLGALTPLQAAGVPLERPNVVLILVEDMGYGDVGSFGSKLDRIPISIVWRRRG